MKNLLCLFLFIPSFIFAQTTQPNNEDKNMIVENLHGSAENGYTLMPGPKAEGVVMMWGGGMDALEAFHKTPWLDSTSVASAWDAVEPADQQFDFSRYDGVLEEVRKYNKANPGANRTMQVRVVGGRYSPKWFAEAGIKLYETGSSVTENAMKIPVPYDNPELFKQIRELYRAVYEHFKDAPEVVVYHGSWSGGPWEEIFHPREGEPLPPGYTREKYMQSMVEQVDILIDEYCLKGKIGEISYSGLYPPKTEMDITGIVNARIVQRLGKRSPFIIVNSDGWGYHNGRHKVSAGHERDMNDTLGLVTIGVQAWGDNWGTKPGVQNDWVELVEVAKNYDTPYAEIYASDVIHLDTKHRIEEGFAEYRRWLKERNRVLYQREGVVRQVIKNDKPMYVAGLDLKADMPVLTVVTVRARSRVNDGQWSGWIEQHRLYELPAGDEIELEATLHTDDGMFTPTFYSMTPELTEEKPKKPVDNRPGRKPASKPATQPATQ